MNRKLENTYLYQLSKMLSNLNPKLIKVVGTLNNFKNFFIFIYVERTFISKKILKYLFGITP